MIRDTFYRTYDKIICFLIVNRYKGTLTLLTVPGWSNETRFAHSICTCMISCIGKRKYINAFFIIDSLFRDRNHAQGALRENKPIFRPVPDRRTFDRARVNPGKIWLSRLEMEHLRLPYMSLHPVLFLVRILNKILFRDQTFKSFIKPWTENKKNWYIGGVQNGSCRVPF